MGRLINMLQPWNSIRNKIFFSILLFLVIPFLLTFNWIDKPLERTIEQKIGDSAQEALHQVSFNVELFLQDMLRSSVDISMNPSILSMLKTPEQYTEFEKLRIKDSAFNKLFSSYFTDAYVSIMDLHGNLNSSWYVESGAYDEFSRSGWYKEMMKEPYQIRWMLNANAYTYTNKQPLITLLKTVTDMPTNRNIGMLIFSVAELDMRKYLSKLEGDVYMVDPTGTVISSPSAAMVGANVADKPFFSKIWAAPRGQAIVERDGEKMIVNYDTVAKPGWKIVQLIPYDTVFKQIFDIRRANILIVSLIFLVFLVITFTISYGISRPLKLLNKKMQDIELKEFNSTLAASGPKEIATLISTYNKMVHEIRHLLHRLKEQYQQKEDMRFRVLQAQINPHFILNTLNNIKWMAYIRNNHEVGEMISSLGAIMEASIGRGDSLIPLRKEIAYIENYVNLMKMKYNDKLSIRYDIPAELMDCEVVKFMLQPIVENSIIHGIDPMKGKGEIFIRAVKEGEELRIYASDNGVGMTGDKRDEMNRLLSETTEDRQLRRIGVKNVHERIRLQYGDEYGLTIGGAQPAGTCVEFRLPLKAAKEENDNAESDAGR